MITEAIKNLYPGSAFSVVGETYEGITWMDSSIPMPSKEELELEVENIKQKRKNEEYKRLRFLEYPRMEDYLDAVVKNDQEAIQSYIDACLAVKAKYPKPE